MIRPVLRSLPMKRHGDDRGLFETVAPQHEVGEVVCGSGALPMAMTDMNDTGKAVYEAAVAAQKVPRSSPQLMKGGENKIV